MRRHPRNPLWQPAAGWPCCGALALTILALAGCAKGPLAKGTFEPTDAFAGSERQSYFGVPDFSMEVVRLTDVRQPRSLERKPREQILDTHDPDTLLHGLTTRLPVMYDTELGTRAPKPRHYKIELDVKRLETEILRGTFASGAFGRYAINYEVEAIARRPDSTVVVREGYRFSDTENRPTYNGRSPSLEKDEAKLVDLVARAVAETAARLEKDIARADRSWRPDKEKPVPTQRINIRRLPTLNKATGAATVNDSDLVSPKQLPVVPTYAPDSVEPVQPVAPVLQPSSPPETPITWGDGQS